ncbi:MAG TPA: anti-sigma factor RsbA family regulatory protein [Thermobifida alba]|nr:anti-sigma factor RsbA family regulatory protein [Thermobifida alba]
MIDAGATGLVHEAAIYGDDDELLDVVVPFVAAGARAGEAVVVVLDRRGAARVRAATVEDPRIAYLPQEDTYARPAATLRALRSHVDRRLAGGAGRVRMVGAFPPPAVAASWDAWCRYEAAVDRVFADDPVSLLCAYDARVATGDVLADAEQLHHRIALPGGTRVVPRRTTSPEGVVARHPPRPADPLEAEPPAIELVDPTVRTARARAQALARAAGAGERTADEVALAVSEVVSNAHLHGRPPVVVRGWVGPDRIVVTVADRGTGPADPLVGLVPAAPDARDGRGLWIVHQLCPDVDLVRAEGAFTVRMTVPRSG